MAQLIAAEIEDGSCLQIGIGAMPNAVCSLLLESGVRDLGVHTEMLTDGIVDLYRAGVVTGARKTLYPGKVVCTFGVGTKTQYETADRNPDFLCHAVDQTNLPHIVMQNDRVVSINNTTQMDLQGQAACESDGHRHISGTGGQLQFVRGAYASKGGKSFICMSSTYERHGVRASRIVVDLTPGNVVTSTRADMMYVVTEYGMVNLKGKSVPERARAMISIAHPDFREELEREAREHGLIPRGLLLRPRFAPRWTWEGRAMGDADRRTVERFWGRSTAVTSRCWTTCSPRTTSTTRRSPALHRVPPARRNSCSACGPRSRMRDSRSSTWPRTATRWSASGR